MMIKKVYTVFDEAAGAYLQPFFSSSNRTAMRAVEDVMSDPSHQFNVHADDFTLFCIGEYDEDSGSLIPQDKVSLGNLIQFKKDDPNA